jgi:hypothetical protein
MDIQYSGYFFPVVNLLAHNVTGLFFKCPITNSTPVSDRLGLSYPYSAVSLLAVSFRVILVGVTCSASCETTAGRRAGDETNTEITN